MAVSSLRQRLISRCALVEYSSEGSGSLRAGGGGFLGSSDGGGGRVAHAVTLSASSSSGVTQHNLTGARGALGLGDLGMVEPLGLEDVADLLREVLGGLGPLLSSRGLQLRDLHTQAPVLGEPGDQGSSSGGDEVGPGHGRHGASLGTAG